jgi:hypothetical protein
MDNLNGVHMRTFDPDEADRRKKFAEQLKREMAERREKAGPPPEPALAKVDRAARRWRGRLHARELADKLVDITTGNPPPKFDLHDCDGLDCTEEP